MGRFDLTDAEWTIIAPLLPGGDGQPRRGRPCLDDRRMLDAIFHVLRVGLPLARPAAPLRSAHDGLQPLSGAASSPR